MIVYKLTDQSMQTYGGTQWTLGEWREASGEGELCTKGWLHAYEHPLLAVLHSPIHGVSDSPRLFRAEAEGAVKRDGQIKLGASRMRIVEEMDLPAITVGQRVRYAIFCAMGVYHDESWTAWATSWIDGRNRSNAAAWAARSEAEEAVRSAAWAARSAEAARSAAWAARSAEATRSEAARSEAAVWMAEAARSAAWAARSEAEEAARSAEAARSEAAAWVAARAAEAARAASAASDVDLIDCAKRAVEGYKL